MRSPCSRATCVSPVTVSAVISPLKSESAVTADDASADACSPFAAVTLVVTELAATIDPSAGYAYGPSKATASSGAVRTRGAGRVLLSGHDDLDRPGPGRHAGGLLRRSLRGGDDEHEHAGSSREPDHREDSHWTYSHWAPIIGNLRDGGENRALTRRRRVEMLAGEGAEALAGGVVRAERPFVRILRVGRDLLGHGPHLARPAPRGAPGREAAPRSSSRSRRRRGRRCRRATGRAGGRSGCRRTCGTRGSGAATRSATRCPGSRAGSAR